MTPQEIGDLLGTPPESVVAAREAALEQVATQLDMHDGSQLDEVRARLAELPAEAWTGGERPRLSVVREEERGRAQTPPRERRRSRLPLLLALLAVAVVALVVVLATSGGSDNSTAPKPQASKPKPAPQKPKPAKKHKPKPSRSAAPTARLAAFGSSGATGTAALTSGGQRLVIKASGLASGTYQVWLYNSVIDAASLTKVSGTSLSLDLKLPANASHFRYVDISREPDDGNPNHSGESVLRVALKTLSR
jgi:hypothetical protein